MLVLMPDEAQKLARDLLEIAEEIEGADGAKTYCTSRPRGAFACGQ
jgi:hypothetical protein